MAKAVLQIHPYSLKREVPMKTREERIKVAQGIVDEARANAPVLLGNYRDGMRVEVSGNRVQVVDDDWRSFFKEYGTSNTPAHATLTNAAMNHGKYSGMRPRRGR